MVDEGDHDTSEPADSGLQDSVRCCGESDSSNESVDDCAVAANLALLHDVEYDSTNDFDNLVTDHVDPSAVKDMQRDSQGQSAAHSSASSTANAELSSDVARVNLEVHDAVDGGKPLRFTLHIPALREMVRTMHDVRLRRLAPPLQEQRVQRQDLQDLHLSAGDTEKRQQSERASQAHGFPLGALVESHSLERLSLNGKKGRVQCTRGDRVLVDFGSEGIKALKPSNLRLEALEVLEALPDHLDEWRGAPGAYEECGKHHGRPMFRRLGEESTLDFRIFFWDDRSPPLEGWHLGLGVNLDWRVFFQPEKAARVPPRVGWRVAQRSDSNVGFKVPIVLDPDTSGLDAAYFSLPLRLKFKRFCFDQTVGNRLDDLHGPGCAALALLGDDHTLGCRERAEEHDVDKDVAVRAELLRWEKKKSKKDTMKNEKKSKKKAKTEKYRSEESMHGHQRAPDEADMVKPQKHRRVDVNAAGSIDEAVFRVLALPHLGMKLTIGAVYSRNDLESRCKPQKQQDLLQKLRNPDLFEPVSSPG